MYCTTYGIVDLEIITVNSGGGGNLYEMSLLLLWQSPLPL